MLKLPKCLYSVYFLYTHIRITYSPPFPAGFASFEATGLIFKMEMIKKQGLKESAINALISLGVVIIAYLVFNHFNPSIEEMLLPIIFLLVFILLELPNKKLI